MCERQRDVKGKPTKQARSEGSVDGRSALSAETLARLRAVAAVPDEQIDTSDPDAPEVLDWFGAVRGRFYRPTKRLLTLRVDADVVEYFKREAGAEGGYQTAMNRTLRAAMLRGLRRREDGGKGAARST